MTPENHIDALHKAISNMKKQTAVEWLFAHLVPHLDWSKTEDRTRFRQLQQEALAIEEEQIKSAWNDGWKTATFKVCDWSENAYYDKIKPTDCKFGFYTCKNDDMCDTCDDGENYEQ